VGPYDVLAGHMNGFNTNDIEKTVLHWRYYYDPPEFQVCVLLLKCYLIQENNIICIVNAKVFHLFKQKVFKKKKSSMPHL